MSLAIRLHEADIDPLQRMLREGTCELAVSYSA
jgi:hypothetical protein